MPIHRNILERLRKVQNELYFDGVKNIGRMYLEYVFLEFEMDPILFTCIDDKGKLYLCLCSEIRSGQKWVVTECELETLTDLIENRIDIASAMSVKEQLTIIEMDLLGEETSYIIGRDEIDPLDLPREGTFLCCNQNLAKNYLTAKNLSKGSLHFDNMMERVSAYYERTGKLNTDVYSTKLLNSADTTRAYHIAEPDASSIQVDSIGLGKGYNIAGQDVYQDSVKRADIETLTGDDYLFAA